MTYDPFTRAGALGAVVEELDPAPERIDLARQRYEDLGNWLKEHAGAVSPRVLVYPQGSASLGTTNQNPFTLEFDIDLVISVRYTKTEITQQGLNDEVHGWLDSYVKARKWEGSPLAPASLRKGKRACTLGYADNFHMDVLPVLPDAIGEIEAAGGEPSWLTDRDLTRWQPTNPKGFADWFLRLTFEERAAFAKRAGVAVEDLPVFGGPRTDLQQAVRLLKLHRDHAFRSDPLDLAPPSIVVTALASLAFEKEVPSGDLSHLLQAVVERMPDFVDQIEGELVISNPTCPPENYADRYEGNRAKREKLGEWLVRVRQDVSRLAQIRHATLLTKSVDDIFGDGLGDRIAERLGDRAQHLRSTSRLSSTSAGALGVAETGRKHRDHTFYGDEQI